MDSSFPGSNLSRRHLLRGFTAMAASTFLSGCGADLYRAATTPTTNQPTPSRPSTQASLPNVQPVPAGAIAAGSLTVSAGSVASFAQGFVGLAFEKKSLSTSLFSASAGELIALFKLLGPGVLRIGGSSVDNMTWVPAGNGQTAEQVSPTNVTALAAFLGATGWTCIYGVNLGGSANGSTTPALAAAEVAFVSQQLGSSLVGVELGNECESYGNPDSFYPYNWTLEKFETLWMQMHDAIVAQTPAAPLVGPAAATNIDTWTIPFGEYVTRNRINLLTQHYLLSSPTATVNDLIAPDPALSSQLLQLSYGAESIDVPFRITECASSNQGVSGVSNTYASTLWAIDMIFNCALGGASGVNFQAGGQSAAACVADQQGVLIGAQPAFYGLLLAAMAGSGSMLSTQLNAGSLNVSGYAVQTSDGGLSLVIVNKDDTHNLDLSIVLPSSRETGTLSVLTQGSAGAGPSLTALSAITLQGAAVATNGTFTAGEAYPLTPNGTQLSCYVPALSAVLIQLV